MIHCFEGHSADEVWRKATNALLTDPAVTVQPSRAGETHELLHVVLQIKDPRQRWIVARRDALNIAFALAEVIWILDGRNDSAFLNYFHRRLPDFAGSGSIYHGAYGERLRIRFGLDQLVQATNGLRANPRSRQVVLQIWSSAVDLPGSDGQPMAADIPCNLVSMLKVRDGHLDWTQIMRSNDAYRGIPHNIVQFTYLQEVMAGWLGLEPGSYTHWSDSLHFYAKDLASSPLNPAAAPLPAQTGSMCLSQAVFDSAWPHIRRIAEAVTQEQNTSRDLAQMLVAQTLPQAWANILRILVAEGMRRRGELKDIPSLIMSVTDPVLKDLWARWLVRVSVPRNIIATP